MVGKVTFSQVIQNHGFRILWINQVLMQLSTNALNFALIIWVYKLTNSSFAVSALILTVYLPALLFGIFAGVFVDIIDKKKIIILVDFLLALIIFSFVLVKNYYPLILLNTFLINTLTQFFVPAESSSIPLLVKKRELFLANSLFSLTLYASFMLGYTISGPVLEHFGVNIIFYSAAASLLLATIISQDLPRLLSGRPKKLNGFIDLTIQDTKQTLTFIKDRLNVFTAIGLLSGIQMGIGILAVMVSSYMEKILRIQATDASFVLMLPLGLGMITGALIAGRIFQNIPRRFVVRPAILIAGMLLFIVGAAPSMEQFVSALDIKFLTGIRYFHNIPTLSLLFATGAFLLGICSVSIIIPSQTVLQENTNKEIRGKIFAVLGVMMNGVAAIPILAAGFLADIFGETTVFMVCGIIVFIIGLITLKPNLFFSENSLSLRWRQFLGLGHWIKSSN